MHPPFLLTFGWESLCMLRFSALYLTITFSILLPALTMKNPGVTLVTASFDVKVVPLIDVMV